MIKLGSTKINKIKLGSTTINKVYLGSNQVYPTGGGPPPLVIETFENTPLTGSGTVTWASSGSPTLARSSLNVTQGSFSWKITDDSGSILSSSANGTGYTNAKIDITTVGSFTTTSLGVYESNGTTLVSESYYFAGPGTTTLTVPITAALDITQIRFKITLVDAVSFDCYVDNLRLV